MKASPDGETWGIPVEARIQAVLGATTSIPVPEVLGVADEHERLRRVARETGRHLGALHSVPAVEQFGHVRHDGQALTSARPSGEPANLSVGDPHDTWPAYTGRRNC